MFGAENTVESDGSKCVVHSKCNIIILIWRQRVPSCIKCRVQYFLHVGNSMSVCLFRTPPTHLDLHKHHASDLQTHIRT